ncbi:poly-beta-1,6-N-acetyl-D-glucosamine biosynthesis protein PgaD [Pusillimonas sp.]|uniref:poly-beta-1,6-N-acetyl-D-glucosamine biosynthesis protein PgaD n=1 Tax=Pusillimonas sp. TaxID=3040095 RepID=UPI0037C7F635
MNLLVRTPRSISNRILDVGLTALGWLVFSYFMTAGLIAVFNGVDRSMEFSLMGGTVSTTAALMLYLTICAISALLLMLWGTYRKRLTRTAPHRINTPNDALLAESFALSGPQLEDIRLSRMVVIHHADDGEISRWESADTTSIRLSA